MNIFHSNYLHFKKLYDFYLRYKNFRISSLNMFFFFGFQDFALIIYKMERMVDIGLKGLTNILQGGVRIQRNRNLCYVKSIDWQKIVSKKYHQNIIIEVRKYII